MHGAGHQCLHLRAAAVFSAGAWLHAPAGARTITYHFTAAAKYSVGKVFLDRKRHRLIVRIVQALREDTDKQVLPVLRVDCTIDLSSFGTVCAQTRGFDTDIGAVELGLSSLHIVLFGL